MGLGSLHSHFDVTEILPIVTVVVQKGAGLCEMLGCMSNKSFGIDEGMLENLKVLRVFILFYYCTQFY